MIAAIATDAGTNTSHIAILARSLGLPAVVGLRDATSRLRGGEHAVLDGGAGTLTIQPDAREVEEFLMGHPDVLDVQVIGVPDEKYGEEVMAWIRMRGDTAGLTVDDVREFCRGRLAHYKVPRYVKVVDEFPMTVTGKVRKVEMRELSIAELDLAAASAIETA